MTRGRLKPLLLLSFASCLMLSAIHIYDATQSKLLLTSWIPSQFAPLNLDPPPVAQTGTTTQQSTRQNSQHNSSTKEMESVISSWAGSNHTTAIDLSKSEITCYKPENNHHRWYMTCQCHNCCVHNKIVYVFEETNKTYFSNITTQYMSAQQTFGILHSQKRAQESFVGSPWVETPVHYTSIKRQHIIALWLWNADIWSTWQAEGWTNRDFGPFHWMLMETIERKDKDYLFNFWFAKSHPTSEAPVELNEEPRRPVCYRHLMIGHHHTGERLFLNTITKSPLGMNIKPVYGLDGNVGNLIRGYRDFFLKNTELQAIKPDPKKAVLISRKDSKRRRIVNEAALVSILEEEGFEVEEVVFTSLTLDESNKKIRRAGLVFGSHGAGFANIMVCHNTSSIIEFHPWGFQKWGYAHLAKMLGLEYQFWIAPDETFTEHTEESLKFNKRERDNYRHRDYRVNVEDFRLMVKHVKSRWNSTVNYFQTGGSIIKEMAN